MNTASYRPGDDFSAKYDHYSEMIYRIAVMYLRNRHDAEDVMQEAFIRLLYHAPYFESEVHEKAWLIRVAINLSKNQLKALWKKRVDALDDTFYAEMSHDDACLIQEVLNLPNKYKAVIYLHYYEDYSVKQISQILRIGESAIKMRLNRGRLLLRMELEGDKI